MSLSLQTQLRYVVARLSHGNPLDLEDYLTQYTPQLSLPKQVHLKPFSEEVMKWTYLEDIDLCLPEANP
jgi:hypothetical protein